MTKPDRRWLLYYLCFSENRQVYPKVVEYLDSLPIDQVHYTFAATMPVPRHQRYSAYRVAWARFGVYFDLSYYFGITLKRSLE